MSTKTAELTPAVQYLVDQAKVASFEEYHFLLESFTGRYAADMIQEALDNLDSELTPWGNLKALKMRLAELKQKAHR
jgi:hypothetical protein